MIQTLDSRSCDFYLGLFDGRVQESYVHDIRSGLLCVDIGYGCHLDGESLGLVGRAGILHDLGKRDITLDVLAKPGKLSPDEIAVMHGHVRLGFIALEGFGDERIRYIIAMHHEFKRQGPYPRGGEDRRTKSRGNCERRHYDAQVCALAQFLAVADIYDSLAHKRAYKDALPEDEIEIILRQDFTGNPKLIDEVLRRGVFPKT